MNSMPDYTLFCTNAEQQALQQLVKTADRILLTTLPDISTIDTTRCRWRGDQYHSAYRLFHLLPSERTQKVYPGQDI
uniref:Uncharacterized protein n=1 Tax=Knipowitschia caucasica TaxID=637954 RepID=A0AAV2JL24_KNICA